MLDLIALLSSYVVFATRIKPQIGTSEVGVLTGAPWRQPSQVIYKCQEELSTQKINQEYALPSQMMRYHQTFEEKHFEK